MNQTKTEKAGRGQFKHTSLSAAKAARSLFSDCIARTWTQYHGSGYKMNAYTAAKIVQEQCGCTFRAASRALEKVIPELFADYWQEKLAKDEARRETDWQRYGIGNRHSTATGAEFNAAMVAYYAKKEAR